MSEVMFVQQKRIFFDPTRDRRYPALPARPTDNEIRMALAQNNMSCPLSKVVVSEANRGSMRILRRFAFNAFTDPGHSCRGMNFAIYCGPGQGKTYVVKQWSATIGIPFLFIQSDALTSTWMLFDMLVNKFAESGIPLMPQIDEQHFIVPPCIVFFDEAQALNSDLRTGGLLNAMEANDGWLRTNPPGRNQKQYTINCREICWVAASTDPGIIYKQSSAFYDRFRTHIEWKPAGPSEIAHIVKLDSERKAVENGSEILPDEACKLVAHYEPVPRKAIAFADQMVMERRMHGSAWKEAASIVATDAGIDEYGMPFKIIEILKALAKRPVSDKNIIAIAGCRREQFDSQYALYLLADVEGRGPLTQPTGKGWAITQAGCNELTKRGIEHQGELVLAENFM